MPRQAACKAGDPQEALRANDAMKSSGNELIQPLGIERPLSSKHEAGDAVFLALWHMTPLQFLEPPRHLLSPSHVEAARVEQEIEIHFRIRGPDNPCLRVQLPKKCLHLHGFFLGDEVNLIQHDDVGALHLVDKELRNSSPWVSKCLQCELRFLVHPVL